MPLSTAVIPSANKNDIKAVTDVIDNIVIKRSTLSSSPKDKRTKIRNHQHLCLDKAYNSKSVEPQIIKRDYVPHIRYKRKRGEKKIDKEKISIKRYLASR